VGTTNVTVRFNEEELRRLDELAQRMGRTRSDVVRDLINKFDEVLKGEVEKERKRWMMIGFVSALESAILDPELVLRFVRKNVDVIGYPDFLIGMVKVRNRVLLFSHHDKIGHQLLQQVRSKVEDEVKREEMEIEQEEGDDEEVSVSRPTSVHVRIRGPTRPGAPHAAPGSHRYKILVSSRSAPPVARPTAVAAAGRSVVSGRSGNAETTANTSTPEKQKLTTTSIPTATDPVNPQTRGSNSQVAAIGSGPSPVGPVTQVSTGKPAGDFVIALITNLYHKHREALLRAVEEVMGG
jgi:hypothetical protein